MFISKQLKENNIAEYHIYVASGRYDTCQRL